MHSGNPNIFKMNFVDNSIITFDRLLLIFVQTLVQSTLIQESAQVGQLW